jgi:hypothetical protein
MSVILHQCRRLLNTSAQFRLLECPEISSLHISPHRHRLFRRNSYLVRLHSWGWSINTLLSREGSSFINSESPTLRARDDKVFPYSESNDQPVRPGRRPTFLNLFRPGTSNDLIQLRRLFSAVSGAPMCVTEDHMSSLSRFTPKVPQIGFFLHAPTHIPTGHKGL